MNALASPRNRLIAAVIALGLLCALGVAQGLSAAAAARVVLGLLAVGGIVVWFLKQRKNTPGGFKNAPRMSVVARAGLSQRAGVALIEVDGQAFLVVHGDGYARVRATRRPTPVPVRRQRATDEVAQLPLRRRGGLS